MTIRKPIAIYLNYRIENSILVFNLKPRSKFKVYYLPKKFLWNMYKYLESGSPNC